jgi:hypothetical protein
MTIHYIPWFTEATYHAAKTFMLPHPDMPDTYEEWLDLKRKQIADLGAKGDTVEKIEINPYEFARYCERKACKYDTVALRNFVFLTESSDET